MKKRILSVLVMSALALSLTACGESEKSTENTDSSELTSTTIAKEDDVSEATTITPQTTTEATTTTETIPVNLPDVNDLGEFINGTYFFDQGGKYYAFNMGDKVFHEYEEKTYDYVNGKIAFTYDEKSIINFVTGEVLATADDGYLSREDMSNYSISCNDTHIMPVILAKEAFSGNTYSFGLINCISGEWVLPLSSDYEICQYLSNVKGIAVWGNIVLAIADKNYFYNTVNDKCTIQDEMPFLEVRYCSENKLLVTTGEYYTGGERAYNPAIYDINTGKLTNLGEGEYRFIASLGETGFHGCCLINDESGDCIVLDENLNVLNYDLSEYNIENYDFYNATSELVVFSTTNTEGDSYIIVLDKNGNNIVEPIKDIIYDTCVIGESLIIRGNNGYIINLTTGENNDKYDICNIDPNSGLVQVYEGDNYYLVGRVGRQRLTALPQQVFTHPPSKPDLQLSLYPAFQLFLRLFSAVNFIMTFFANYKSFSIHFRHHKSPFGYMSAPFSVFLLNVF